MHSSKKFTAAEKHFQKKLDKVKHAYEVHKEEVLRLKEENRELTEKVTQLTRERDELLKRSGMSIDEVHKLIEISKNNIALCILLGTLARY